VTISSANDALRCLLRHRLVTPQDVVSGSVSIVDVSRRNPSYLIHRRSRSSFFLKDAAPESHPSGRPVEADVYRQTRPGGMLCTLQPFVPNFVLHDAATGALVLHAVVPPPTSSDDVESFIPPIPRGLNDPLSDFLAKCHALGGMGDSRVRESFPHLEPWVFRFLRPSPAVFRELTSGHLRVLSMMQRRRELVPVLAQLPDEWQWTTFTHGDLRPENLLLDGAGSPPALQVIDWEAAGIGDPWWDVASIIAAWITGALGAAASAASNSPTAAAAEFERSVPAVRHETALFWKAYLHRRPISFDERPAIESRTMRYTAARLLQIAFEWSRVSPTLPRIAVAALQLGMNMLADVDRSRSTFLGTD